jgi:predicted RNA-binding protein (virulence factor B family)
VKKILGVGTALVDVICQVEDNTIFTLNLTKGSMTLIDESQIQEIRSHFKIRSLLLAVRSAIQSMN